MKQMKGKKSAFIGSLIGASLILITLSSNTYAVLESPKEKIFLEPTIQVIEERGKKLYGTSLEVPARYDLRDYIDIEVRDQGWTTQCWAFSASSVLSTHLSYLYDEEYEFSPRHMEYATATTFKDGINKYAYEDRELDEGGHADIIKHYWLSGLGPILEEDMPFTSDVSKIYLSELPMDKAVKRVKEVIHIEPMYKEWLNGELVYTNVYNDIQTAEDIKIYEDELKEIIMDYGGVSAGVLWNAGSFNEENGAYNLNDFSEYQGWHGITVIGWDDTYSKTNFNDKPTRDGAWIALNSYGETIGDNGYIYISYEDLSFDESTKTYVTEVTNVDYDNAYLNFEDAKNSEENLNQISILMDSVLVGWTSCSIIVDEKLLVNNYVIDKGVNTIDLSTPIELTQDSEIQIIYNMDEEYRQYFKEYYYTLSETSMSFGGINTESIIKDSGISFEIETNHNDVDNGNEVSVKILSVETNTEVTGNFDITGTMIENGKTNIVLEPKENCEVGQYKILIEYGEFSEEILVTIYEEQVGYKMYTFESNIIYDKVKSKVSSSVWCYDKLNMIYAEQLEIESIESLSISEVDPINSLSGLENLKGLKILHLTYGSFDDITPIINLINLQDLRIRYAPVEDITGISNLVNLKTLLLNELEIENIEELGTLTNLTVLEIEENNIKDITALSNLTKLIYLKIKYNEIEDITPLQSLIKLNLLEMEYNNIKDISILSLLTNLETLDVSNNNIEDIAPILSLIENSKKSVEFGNQTIIKDVSLNDESIIVDGVNLPNIITCIQNLDSDAILTYENCEVKNGKFYLNNEESLEANISLESTIYGYVILDLIKTNILQVSVNKDSVLAGETVEISIDLTNHNLNAFEGVLEYNKDVFEQVVATDFETNDLWEGTTFNFANNKFVTERTSLANKVSEKVLKVTLKAKVDIPGSIYTKIAIKEICCTNNIENYLYADYMSELKVISISETQFNATYLSYANITDKEIEVYVDLDSFGSNTLYGTLEYDKNIFEEVLTENFTTEVWNELTYNKKTNEFVIEGEPITARTNIFKVKLIIKDTIEDIDTAITFKNLTVANGDKETYLQDQSLNYYKNREITVVIKEFIIKDNIITNVPTEMKFSEFIKYIEGAQEIKLYAEDGNLINEDVIVGTGMSIVINGSIRYKISVRGDISGDGKFSVLDISKMSLRMVHMLELNKVQEISADLNRDSKFSVIDLSQSKLKIVHLID